MCLPLSVSKEAREERKTVNGRIEKKNPSYEPPAAGQEARRWQTELHTYILIFFAPQISVCIHV